MSLRVEAATGYSMLFRYDDSPRCSAYDPAKPPADQQKFCGSAYKPALGLAIGYAPLGALEPFAFGRFGLTDQSEKANLDSAVVLGAGVRLYTMSDTAFKFFLAPFAALDLTHGPVDPNAKGEAELGLTSKSYNTDVLFGLELGPQLDLSRYVGLYASGGLQFGMVRYLGATAGLNVGIQLRAP